MEDKQLRVLAKKIDDLIDLCGMLDKENRLLKTDAIQWQQEREKLIEKTEIAKSKVESMIARLKTLEQES